jgi:mevalonate kinase
MFTGSPVRFKIPSKTFLMGEYVALSGGPALLLSHPPYFEIVVEEGNNQHPFHMKSPAGLHMLVNSRLFEGKNIQFKDPYSGKGGFGASTAQYLGCYLFSYLQKNTVIRDMYLFALESMKAYKSLFLGQKAVPSGYDVIAQTMSGFVFIDAQKKQIELLNWPFNTIEVLVYKTSVKQETHQHLESLQLSDGIVSALSECVEKAVKGLRTVSSDLFFEGSRKFSQILTEQNLVAQNTQDEVAILEKQKGVVQARGCGALGADVIIVYRNKGVELPVDVIKNLTLIWSSHKDGFGEEMSSALIGDDSVRSVSGDVL